MNSLEAIIAWLVLLCFFGLVLTVLLEQKESVSIAKNSINAKKSVLFCSTIIDLLYSNNASGYSGKINCFGKGNQVWAIAGQSKKELGAITIVDMDFGLKVNSLAHYI